MLLSLLLGAAALSACGVRGALITNLPGAPPDLNFKQWSGFIPVWEHGSPLEHRQIHYWFVESQSATGASDPLVLWLTGGPGCSGMLALLTEQGPFNMNEHGTLSLNPWSWNRNANVIYVESPAGVGFSVTPGKSTKYATNDTQTAMDNYSFLRGFLAQPEFAHFRNNEFFIAGESYAGHYVPELAQDILRGNAAGKHARINLKGSMSGNPCTNDDIDGQSYIPFLTNHALISQSDYANVNTKCSGDFVHNDSPSCKTAKTEVFTRMSNRINPYNIYAKCVGKGAPSPGYCFTDAASTAAPMVTVFREQLVEFRAGHPGDVGSQTMVPCMSFEPERKYLNSKAVREALHIPASMDSTEWFVCSQVLDYTVNEHDMIPIYDFLNQHMRVLIYSGDVDSCVNYLGTETAALKIKAGGEKKPWHAWMVDDQVAGYAIGLGTNLTFATVKDAGHMVPSKDIGKPENAYNMFMNFVNGKSP